MLPGGLVGDFSELANQFLEHLSHLGIAHSIGMEVDGGELLGDLVQENGTSKPVDMGVEIEFLEDVAHGGRECLHVGAEVLADVILIAHELLHVERGRIEEVVAGFPQEERFRVQSDLLSGGQLSKHSGLGGLQHAVKTPQDREGEDHLAVFGLLVIAAQARDALMQSSSC